MCLTIATDAVCCAGTACCSLACCCCKSCLGSTFKEQVKMAYIVLNVVAMLVDIFIFFYIGEFFDDFVSFINCPENSENCLGVSSIYRMSFVLACMYAVLILCMLCRGEVAKSANEGLWLLKILYIAAFFFGCLYIPNSFFEGYVYFSIVISGLYMIFQVIMLIDVFYLWGQSWVKVYDDGGEYMKYVLIFTTLILYSVAFTLNAYNFIWYSGCGTNIFMNIFTLILIVGFTVVQLLGLNPSGSLLTSGAMAVYITYQAFSAQASHPNAECNAMLNEHHESAVMITETVVGFVMNIVALMYLTFGTTEQSAGIVKTSNSANIVSEMMDTQQQKNEDKQQEEEQQPIQQQLTQEQQVAQARQVVNDYEMAIYKSNNYVVFHIIMFITVVYMAMMITNWGAPSINDNTTINAYQPSDMSYWIKMITSWIAALLYIWTLVAPHIFPERDFS